MCQKVHHDHVCVYKGWERWEPVCGARRAGTREMNNNNNKNNISRIWYIISNPFDYDKIREQKNLGSWLWGFCVCDMSATASGCNVDKGFYVSSAKKVSFFLMLVWYLPCQYRWNIVMDKTLRSDAGYTTAKRPQTKKTKIIKTKTKEWKENYCKWFCSL